MRADCADTLPGFVPYAPQCKARGLTPAAAPAVTSDPNTQDAAAKITVTARGDHQLECELVGPRLQALDELLQVRAPQHVHRS